MSFLFAYYFLNICLLSFAGEFSEILYSALVTTKPNAVNLHLKGTLVMDVFDEKSGDQIWQGVAVGTIQKKPEKRENSIPKTVAALMKKFHVDASE